jgi:hypothetical protein
LDNIQKLVESSYVNGVPQHRLASASSKEYDANASQIFVADWATFETMSDSEIQDVFRHRHILVRNGPVKTVNWDLEGLSMLGPLDGMMDFQGEWKSGKPQRIVNHHISSSRPERETWGANSPVEGITP